jgi:hypothetical protein
MQGVQGQVGHHLGEDELSGIHRFWSPTMVGGVKNTIDCAETAQAAEVVHIKKSRSTY